MSYENKKMLNRVRFREPFKAGPAKKLKSFGLTMNRLQPVVDFNIFISNKTLNLQFLLLALKSISTQTQLSL